MNKTESAVELINATWGIAATNAQGSLDIAKISGDIQKLGNADSGK